MMQSGIVRVQATDTLMPCQAVYPVSHTEGHVVLSSTACWYDKHMLFKG